MNPHVPISRPPTAVEKSADRIFRGLARAFAWLTVLLVFWIVFEIGGSALPAIRERGLGFITGQTWDRNKDLYGIMPEIWGTLYSSLLALVIGTLFGVAAAIFLSEGFLGGFLFWVLKKFGSSAEFVGGIWAG